MGVPFSNLYLTSSVTCVNSGITEPPPTLWVGAMLKAVRGARALRREQELGALKVLWAGGNWDQHRKHAAKLSDSAACRFCGAFVDNKRSFKEREEMWESEL